MITDISINTCRQGLHDITTEVAKLIQNSESKSGLCTLFCQHTSASLLIQESYDSSARRDLENWLNRLVPEDDPLYTHTLEGSDDMPAHIKAALTASTLSIPFTDNKLLLGAWQGIYLWEHRHAKQHRNIIIHLN